MEDTEKAKHEFVEMKAAGVETLANKVPPPSNYSWPVPLVCQNSHRKLSFDNIHTEYRDNYLKWAVEKVCN